MAGPNYDLEERTFQFAQEIRNLIKILPFTLANREDSKQLIRCSASIGANYIEANEALSKKDFSHRVKIARKEAKESISPPDSSISAPIHNSKSPARPYATKPPNS